MDTLGSTVVSLNSGSAVTLSSGVATLTGVILSGAGTHTITANYAGVSGSFISSSGTGSVVVKALSSVGLTSSDNPALLSSAVTFTATVSSGSGTPSGSVSFYDGTTLLGSGTLASGVATYATSSLTAGSHSITASYGGSSSYATATSSAVQQVVADLDVGVSSGSQTSATVSGGGTAIYALTIAPSSGSTFPAQVTLAAIGAPIGSRVTINPQTIVAGAAATDVTLTIQVPAQAAAIPRGLPNWSFATFAFGMLLLPFAPGAGRLTRSAVLKTAMLVAIVISAGVWLSCGSNRNPAPTPQAQTYTITVTATSGALTHSTALTLIVQ
jgi:hypothetical protein